MTVTSFPVNGSDRDKELLYLHGNQRGNMGGGKEVEDVESAM